MPHKSNWVTAISYAIRPDHAHEIAASPCQQSRPDDHVIVFAAFQRVESGTCFAEPEMLHRVLVRANLPGICTEAKSKESSAFMEPHRTIRICANHEHVLFLRGRLEPLGTAICCNRKTK